ncbi:uncharacterized protein RHOBADRAFT_53855 [Rhodotorula graminis WP1]|uniref:Uncharacterized protein n=1 Tax=Rhodotorula graminis (strain WP1) TaxID=578459 RepID=A0A194S350_RHOGW|nr:uncharacterized protein RHOBADRAFT_53855 [Rhodotorula graminis WP1]KPV74930.1 hypothetical protein RHOBADRAFT_53855 [Rhodotorula graminis WP1]
MGSAVSSVGDAVVSAATWATAPASTDSSASPRRTDSSLDHADVLDVLDILSQRIPTELALAVVEAAELWPAYAQAWTGDVTVSAGPQGRRTARTCVVSPPLPLIEGAPEQLVRRVSVWTDSRDQGYSSFPQHHGTREASSSWFELVLLRPVPPPASPSTTSPTASPPLRERSPPHDPAPDDRDLVVLLSGLSLAPVLAVRIHSNLHSTPSFVPFTTVLSRWPPAAPGHECDPPTPASCGADEVESVLAAARAGDRFAVRACAQYPMWVNRVRGAAVKVEVAAL